MEGLGADCQQTDGCKKIWADRSVEEEEEVRRGTCLHQVFILWNSTTLKKTVYRASENGKVSQGLWAGAIKDNGLGPVATTLQL